MTKTGLRTFGAIVAMMIGAPALAADLNDIGLGGLASTGPGELAQFQPETYPSKFVGAYLGVQGGASWVNDFQGVTAVIPGTTSSTQGGPNGGIFAGYNYGAAGSRIVYGLEVTGQDANADFKSPDYKTYLDYEASVRARIGYGIFADRFLPFFTLGGSGGYFNVENYVTGNNNSGSINGGWNIGGGMEMLMTKNILLRAEYVYTKFPEVSFATHQTTFGIGYKF